MMTQLETYLRAWMHERAARVDPSPQLLQADYHPRRALPRTRLALAGGATAAAAALAAMLTLAGSASTAFAGWTPQPTTPTPAQLAAATAYCAKNVPDPGLPLALAEARGPFTVLVYSNGATDDFCTLGPSFRNASGWTASPPVRPADGTLFLWTDHTATATDGSAYGWMIAQVGPDVSDTDLTLDDGSAVTATVSHGWAVAWWPGTHHLAAAQLTTPGGTTTQRFAKYPCDVDECHGGPHGGAPGGGPGGG